MTWSDVEAYVAARAPKSHAGFRGVAASDLTRFERETGTTLPGAYRAFLLRAGTHAGGLHPLGDCWAHDFPSFAAVPPDEAFLEAGLLRIGLFTDESALTPSDLYLDVSQGECDDAMLFDYEQDQLFDRQWLRPRGLSFLDTVSSSFFQQLQTHRLETRLGIDVARADRAETRSRIAEVLRTLGLGAVLAPSDRLSTHAGLEVSALIEARTSASYVFVDLGGDDHSALGRVTRALLDGVPGLLRLAGGDVGARRSTGGGR
ncbi:MAG: SMI1/KNR4 family protein [Myxococcales bacterium]|nr:SMI1/KNR4 family protein [Myxococcales bacterium]